MNLSTLMCVLIYPHPNMFKFKSKDTKKKKKKSKKRKMKKLKKWKLKKTNQETLLNSMI